MNSRHFYGRPRLALQCLEPRDAPATLVNATTLSYRDIDGDTVTVKVSKPILDSATINNVFQFSSGFGAVNGNNNTPQALHLIILANLADPTDARGMSLRMTAT